MKDGSPSKRRLRLEQPEAARLLTDPQARRFLEPFIAQEQSVSQVAAELGADLSSVLYRVRQFQRLGLVVETRLEPRRGRAVRYYRSIADGFYAPFAATPYATADDLSPGAFRDLQATLNRSVGKAWQLAAGEPQALGLHVFRNEAGNLSQNIVPDPDDERPNLFFEDLLEPDAPAVWDTWGIRRLSREDAKALQRELASVFKRYAPNEQADGTEAYIVRLAMAPLDEG